MTLELNMVFWTDCQPDSTRERNVKYTAKELIKLSNFLNNHLKCSVNVYDFSYNKVVDGGIHIPYTPTEFKKSEKINTILDRCQSEMFAVMDSDCFVNTNDYEKLAQTIHEHGKDSCYTFDVLDFTEVDTRNIVIENATPSNFQVTSRFPGRAGGLGAFYITNTENLRKHNGFNTKYTTWGGEDGEIYDRIDRDGSIKKVSIKNDNIKLFHLSHFSDRENINYFNHDEYVRNNY